MNDSRSIAITQADITGLACQQALRDAGPQVRLYNKGRAVGGRLADDGAGLLVGGDWALGPRAKDGWASGCAMATHLLAHRHERHAHGR